jgi:inosose dehydratase
VLEAIRKTNYASWLMVELDSFEGDPKSAALTSRKYLDVLLNGKMHTSSSN